MINRETRQRLLMLAEKASAGEWNTHDRYPYEVLCDEGQVAVCTPRPDQYVAGNQGCADAAYIAAVNPVQVIQLLKDLERMSDALQVLTRAADHMAHTNNDGSCDEWIAEASALLAEYES